MNKTKMMLMSVSLTVILAGCVGQSSGGDENATGTAALQTPDTTAGSDVIETPAVVENSGSPENVDDPVLEVEPSNDSPAAALQGGLNAYKTMDAAEFDKYFETGIAGAMATDEEPDEASINHYKVVFENLSWTIRTEASNDGEGYVEVDVTNGDYSKAMETVGARLQQETEGEEGQDYMQRMNEMVKEEMAKLMPEKPMNTLVFLVETDEGWKISADNMPLFIAIQGGGTYVTEAQPTDMQGGDTGESLEQPTGSLSLDATEQPVQ